MKRRGKAGGKAAVLRRPKAAGRKRGAVAKAKSQPRSVYAALKQQLDRKTRELDEALKQQAATAEVLKVISRSTFDLRVVLDTLTESAARLCEADRVAIHRREGDYYPFAASWGFPREFDEFMRNRQFRPEPETALGRVLTGATTIHVPDIEASPAESRAVREWRKIGGFRTVLGVPLLREGTVIGAIVLTRTAVRPFTDRQIELVQTFADQAVIAIENVRLFEAEQQRTSELSESLEQQTATSEVLKVISSSPGDLEPVFAAMLENATRICEANFGNMFLIEDGTFRTVAMHNAPAAYCSARTAGPFRPPADSAPGRLVSSKDVVHVADLRDEPTYLRRDPFSVTGVELAGIRTLLAVPMLKDGALIGAIHIYRQEVQPFTDKQIALVRNFAAQAVIAIENTRLLSELRQSLEQQTATADVLRVISSSPGALEPVFTAMLENATRICDAKFGIMTLYEGGPFRAVALHNAPPEFAEARRREPQFFPAPSNPLARVADTKATLQIPDLRQDECYLSGEPATVVLTERGGARTLIDIPMLKDGELVGVFGIYRQEVRPFTDKQIELLQNFAAQAVIAIENTRLLNELRQSLEQQTATADVLRVISSSPGELEPVFQAMLENATRICEAKFGTMYFREGDGFRAVAMYGAPPAYVESRLHKLVHPGPNTSLGRAVATKRVVQIEVADADPGYAAGDPMRVAAVDLGGVRTLLSVPLLKEDELVGAISIYRQEVRAFTDKQTALVQNFAAQAVIAIENTRLLNELRQSLEQQTATAEVLGVISSSPGELEPVFAAMLANATRICEAEFGFLWLVEDGGFRAGAMHGAPPEVIEERRRDPILRPRSGSPLARVAAAKQVLHIVDVAEEVAQGNRDPALLGLVERAAARTVLLVPMLKEGEFIGVVSIYRKVVHPFADKQIELVKNFAAQAVIAIENTRLLNELRKRTTDLTESLEQQTATAKVLQVISSSPGELEPVFSAMLKNAVRICGARFGNLQLYDGKDMRIVAMHNAPREFAELRRDDPVVPLKHSILGPLVKTKKVVHVADLAGEEPFSSSILAKLAGARSALAVPMLREGELVGGIAIYHQEVRPFTEKQIELLTSFAAQAVIAIENTRLLNE
ncbi:MAG: GAF domain-containing protein, partial [Xanthobacteraceae bacterium]